MGRIGAAPASRTFARGMDVVMVESGTGLPAEIARVSSISEEGGYLTVEGYTARFSLQDGSGQPLVETQDRPGCTVLDMQGRVVRPAMAPSPVAVRNLRPRFDVRRATDADLALMADRRRASRLAVGLGRHLSRLGRRGEAPPLDVLARIEAELARPGAASTES